MNGDKLRAARFWRTGGYHASEVDDLLGQVAEELDAGQRPGPLIGNAAFRRDLVRGYDPDAVDWFFEQLLRRSDRSELAGMNADPWRDLPAANVFTRVGPGDLAERSAQPTRQARRKYLSEERRYFAGECADAWRDFGQQPGTQLWWGRAGWRRELRTAEQHAIASVRGYSRASIRWWGYSRGYGRPLTINAGGRSFSFKAGGAARSSSTDTAEIAARTMRDMDGHFPEKKTSRQKRQTEHGNQKPKGVQRLAEAMELVDDTGMPILYVSGQNYDKRAYACITFPDLRWLRFLVRGTTPSNAIMTAVDQAGNRVARYRISHSPSRGVEITVHPELSLTDELVLAIAISAPWLRRYFRTPGEGGGG